MHDAEVHQETVLWQLATHLDRSSCAAGSGATRPRQSGSRAGGAGDDGGVRCCLGGGTRCRRSATFSYHG